MSLYEFLIKNGISKEDANVACICAENDLPFKNEKIEDLYWVWENKMLRKEYL